MFYKKKVVADGHKIGITTHESCKGIERKSHFI